VDDAATVPEGFLHQSGRAKDIPLNDPVFINADHLKVDIDRRFWIDPVAAFAKAPEMIAPPHVAVSRAQDGFQVTLDRRLLGRHLWEVDAEFDPNRAGGVRWLRVVRVVEPA
jgi:hypothetical protein